MQPVRRSLQVLTAVSTAPGGVTLQDLSRLQEVPVASMHRMLAVLVSEQYLVRSESTKRYFLGPAARELGGPTRSVPIHSKLVYPALHRLSEATGETVFITELIEGRAICVSLIGAKHPLRLFVNVGQEMPLHAAASARVLLADLPPDELAAVLSAVPMTAFTQTTPTTPAQLGEHLADIRRVGHDVCENELDRDVWAVAVPVRDTAGSVVAAVTMAAPVGRVPDADARATALRLTRKAAASLAAAT